MSSNNEVAHIGPYVVRELLGEGGMGRGYRAHDPYLDRDVAIKLIRKDAVEGLQGKMFRRRFESEAKGCAKLIEEGIAAIYQFCHSGDEPPFFVMEYVPGRLFEDFVDAVECGSDCLRIVGQVAQGL